MSKQKIVGRGLIASLVVCALGLFTTPEVAIILATLGGWGVIIFGIYAGILLQKEPKTTNRTIVSIGLLASVIGLSASVMLPFDASFSETLTTITAIGVWAFGIAAFIILNKQNQHENHTSPS